MTISRFGIAEDAIILNDIQSQNLEFIPNQTENILLMKIEFAQKYRQDHFRSTTWIGSCYFYVAYNRLTSKFYRLGGFDTVDSKDFFEDLKSGEEINLILDETLRDNIDFGCLRAYSSWSDSKKRRQGFNCFEKCADRLKLTLKILVPE